MGSPPFFSLLQGYQGAEYVMTKNVFERNI